MHIEINTPALLFPAISLLLLAYTNRFLGLSSTIRSLHHEYQQRPDPKILGQLDNLRHRVALIRGMQISGTLSIFCCVISMVLVFVGYGEVATWVFGSSLLLMSLSLALSLRELFISGHALTILLADMAEPLAAHHQRESSRPWRGPEEDEPPP